MINHDQALQVRMRKLLKEKFQALDIARPLMFFERENWSINKCNNESEYVAIVEDGVPKVFFNCKNNEDALGQSFSEAICLDQQVSLTEVILLLAEYDVVFLKTLNQVFQQFS